MAAITFNIPDVFLPRIIAAMQGLFPVPVDEDNNPTHSPAAWARECVRRFIIKTVRRHERRSAMNAASETVDVPDDSIS